MFRNKVYSQEGMADALSSEVWASVQALEALVQTHENAIERIEQTLQELQEQLYNLRN